jgi:hypothetical protein
MQIARQASTTNPNLDAHLSIMSTNAVSRTAGTGKSVEAWGRRVHPSFSDLERKSVLRLFISERLSTKSLGMRRSFAGQLRSRLNPLGEPCRYTGEPGVQLVVVI